MNGNGYRAESARAAYRQAASARRRAWILLYGLLLVLAVVVPYTALAGIGRWTGAFLFWILFALVAVVAMVLITAKWRD